MKHSIRKQFAGIFIGMMAATVICTWLINSIFLDDVYLSEKQKDLGLVYETINKAEKKGQLDLEEFYDVTLSKLCDQFNITGLVVDMRTQEMIAFGADERQSQRQLWDNLLFSERFAKNQLQKTEHYTILITNDKMTKTDYVEILGYLENGDMILLRTPLESIRDSVMISNRFLASIGLMTTIVSAMVIWFLTKRYTKPILELAKISEKMANLNFEAKYSGEKDNEIGILGENINFMSEELKKTISELKTANIELKKDIQLKEKNEEMRSEFLANVSHELKTPIALIQGYAEGLRDNITENQEEREYYCDVIIDESRKMNEMVKNLLTLNQLEYGNDTTVERFDLTELIRNYLQATEILFLQNGIHLKWEVPDSVYVWADELKIEEVIANYVSNAIHHVKPDKDGNKEIKVDIIRYENRVKVIVFNTGAEIPEESLTKVWDKFYKIDKARTREYGGNGIGLSIVKAIMDSMNGGYGVENKENGVEFWFELEKA